MDHESMQTRRKSESFEVGIQPAPVWRSRIANLSPIHPIGSPSRARSARSGHRSIQMRSSWLTDPGNRRPRQLLEELAGRAAEGPGQP
ncbi:MAG: hypothetical protein CL908_24290 [Deltaproteobacteria bacterium]|nr:hypothetical protein [Deltaproteobacteria bacterium]